MIGGNRPINQRKGAKTTLKVPLQEGSD